MFGNIYQWLKITLWLNDLKTPCPISYFKGKRKQNISPSLVQNFFQRKDNASGLQNCHYIDSSFLLAGATNGEENSEDNRRNSMLCNWAVGGPLCSVKLNSLCAVLDVARPGLTYVAICTLIISDVKNPISVHQNLLELWRLSLHCVMSKNV